MAGAVKPILFSAPMVRALLDGRKTQTRRILRNQETWDRVEAIVKRFPHQKADVPYQPGDLLWVRESITRFDKGSCDQHVWYMAGRNDGGPYGISDGDTPWPDDIGPAGGAPYNVPSIHMPRWASRLTLEVTEVRVQRLQKISERDARDEGAFSVSDDDKQQAARLAAAEGRKCVDAVDYFRQLWNGINAPRGLGWDANPWISAITFTVHQENIDLYVAAGEAA